MPKNVKRFFAWLASEPFIVAIGVATWAHSAWAWSAAFGVPMRDLQFSSNWIATLLALLPGALMAFAIDVGQIHTVHEIRKGAGGYAMRIMFFVLAGATALMQWIYIVVHFPALTLGAGIRPEWEGGIRIAFDSMVFVLPILMPVAMVLYTFGAKSNVATKPQSAPLEQMQPPRIKASHNGASQGAIAQDANGEWVKTCALCEWESGAKPTERSATNAYNAHTRSGKHKQRQERMNE